MLDIIAIGDATLDTFLTMSQASVQCSLKKQNCKICFDFADKIPVEEFYQVIGGNAANNAVGSARLGLKSAIYTVVGDDITGQKVKETLKKERVRMDYVRVDRGDMTNYSVVINYKGERTIFVYHHPRRYRLPRFAKAKWVYLTSIGTNHDQINEKVISYVRKTGARLGFNPGTHQIETGLKALIPLMKVTTAFIVNKEEANEILGTNHREEEKLLVGLKEHGPEIVVVTDGPKGTYAYNGHEFFYMPIFPAPRIEATGAGDSFSTAFIAALIHGKEIDEALKWGNINAASVIQKIGPQEGLMKKSAMMKTVREHKNFQAKIYNLNGYSKQNEKKS